MRGVLSMAFWLILILILVAYWKGTTENVSTIGGAVRNIINTLQGRKSDGTFANYPS